VDVLPVPEGARGCDSRGRKEAETGDKHERGVVEDLTVVGERIRKLLHLMEDMRNVRFSYPLNNSILCIPILWHINIL